MWKVVSRLYYIPASDTALVIIRNLSLGDKSPNKIYYIRYANKRERGKQRKAVKNLAAGNGNDSITQIVAQVRKGDNKTTILLGNGSLELEKFNGISYEQSGILSVVLGFLNRCDHETFDGVMVV